MLRAAGLSFESLPADIDEDSITAQMLQQNESPKAIASALACQKAQHISQQNPAAFVIGSDQILECDGQLLSKAANAEEAATKLRHLSGRDHSLISAVCVIQDGTILWQDTDCATLTMRDLSDADIAAYTTKAGEALTRSVGAYEIESLGAWLFDRIEGDYFTILGMPLLKLLRYLQDEQGASLE